MILNIFIILKIYLNKKLIIVLKKFEIVGHHLYGNQLSTSVYMWQHHPFKMHLCTGDVNDGKGGGSQPQKAVKDQNPSTNQSLTTSCC